MTEPVQGKTVTARHAVNWIVGAFCAGLLVGAITVLAGVVVGTRF